MTERDLYLWLSSTKGIELNEKFYSLSKFNNIYCLWEEINAEKAEQELKPKTLNALRESKKLFNPDVINEELHKKEIKYVCKIDDAYPKKLLNIKNPPFGLFYKGKLPKDTYPSVSVVGSRQNTSYGMNICNEICLELSQNKVQIISGLAIGIDCYAHKAALRANSLTYGVLGTGVDIIYPKENYDTFIKMYQEGGVISEYPLGTPGLKNHFPERNRIIAGLSDALLVIEARAKSGTMITVDKALEQGKDVFVVPGRIGDPLSEGCLELIKQGANIITSSNDIALCLKDKYPDFITYKMDEDCQYCFELNENNKKIPLENDEIIVYSCLSLDPKHLDLITIESKMDYFSVFNIISSLVDKGVAFEITPEYFVRK